MAQRGLPPEAAREGPTKAARWLPRPAAGRCWSHLVCFGFCVGTLAVLAAPRAVADGARRTFCSRTYDRAFVGVVQALQVPALGREGTYVLRVRSARGIGTAARLRWEFARGLDVVGPLSETVYVPSTGEFVRHIVVRPTRPADYDIAVSLAPPDTSRTHRTEAGERFVRYLRVRAGLSEDRDSPFPVESDSFPPLLASAPAAPAQTVPADSVRYAGRVTYHDDIIGFPIPIRETTVQLAEQVRRAGFLVEEIVHTTLTGADGRFQFPDVSALTAGGLARVFRINVVLQNATAVLTDHRGTTHKRSTDWENAQSGAERAIAIHWELADGRHALGHILNALLDHRDFLQNRVGFRRRQVQVEYPSLDGGTYYAANGRNNVVSEEIIRIAFEDGFRRPGVLHEYGHAVMTAAYGYRLDAVPFGDIPDAGHSLYTVSDAEFALSEGWAEFMEAVVDDDALNVRAYRNRDLPNIETNRWWTGRADGTGTNTQGEIVEGAVASILWDMSDGPSSRDHAPGVDDDAMAGEFVRIWTVFTDVRPRSVLAWREEWIRRGWPGQTALLAIFETHGISTAKRATDLNRDGIVDILDLVLVAKRFGDAGPFLDPSPDLNGDGVVDILDLVLVALRFGEAAAALAPRMPGTGDFAAIREWIALARAADDGSPMFRRALDVLQRLLDGVAPTRTELLPNYPNPSNPETWIPFRLAHAGHVVLAVYDVAGRPARRWELGRLAAGDYTTPERAVRWDGRNQGGEAVASGVYWVELQAGGERALRRILVAR